MVEPVIGLVVSEWVGGRAGGWVGEWLSGRVAEWEGRSSQCHEAVPGVVDGDGRVESVD